MSDLIDRQVAIDAIGKTSDELYENIQKGATFPQQQWFDGMAHAQSILENLPSAEPELITVNIDHELTQEEYEKLRKDMANVPIMLLPSAQPELIEKTAYIRGFEQGRTQGMIDAQGGKK